MKREQKSQPDEILIDYDNVQTLDDVFRRIVAAIEEKLITSDVSLDLPLDELDENLPATIASYVDAAKFFQEVLRCAQKYRFSIEICPSHPVIHLTYHPRTVVMGHLKANEKGH